MPGHYQTVTVTICLASVVVSMASVVVTVTKIVVIPGSIGTMVIPGTVLTFVLVGAASEVDDTGTLCVTICGRLVY